MFKNFKKKSPKVKAGIIAFVVVILVLLIGVLYSNFKPDPPPEYEVVDVNYGTVTESLDVSGTVESGATEDFLAIEGVMVEEVFVNVGDTVKKGDKIATFNVSGASTYLTEAKNAYDKALKQYNDSLNSSDANAKRKAEIQDEIDVLNKKIEELQGEIEILTKELEGSVTQTTSISDDYIESIALQMLKNGSSLKQIKEFKNAIANVKVPVTDSASSEKQQQLLQKSVELAQLSSELTVLYAESNLMIVADDATLKALKKVADNKKADYESIKSIYDKMAAGWVANSEGIITTINIKPGQRFVPVVESNQSSFDISSLLGGSIDGDTASIITSLLGQGGVESVGTGIRLESYEDMIVSVTVSKSDLLKIQVGMEAVVTSLDSEYEGEVIYVGATAMDSSGSLDLGSIAGSLLGGGSGSNGAVVKVKIKNPDRKVVIGFDVDIKIVLDTHDNVLKVPVEAVIYNNGTYSVFVYDEDDKTVTKRTIVKGSLDESSYEVAEGLVEGEKVVKSPDPKMEDGTKIAMKKL